MKDKPQGGREGEEKSDAALAPQEMSSLDLLHSRPGIKKKYWARMPRQDISSQLILLKKLVEI